MPDSTIHWWVAGIIVLLGLGIYGFSDVLRFSFSRAWAISGVSFDDSIRRRVLWIAPLAMLGVLIVSQLQKSIDEQDAIRQTIKFALFASGLVVTLTSVILASTDLPRDIETRIIFTVVTKPTTRLEIVVGKVMGIAKVSATILALMGIFTWGYLELRSWSMQRGIRQRLEAGTIDPLSRDTYQYWARAGLLSSSGFDRPDVVQVFSRLPESGDSRRWFFANEGDFILPFRATPEDLVPPGVPNATPGSGGIAVLIQVGFGRSSYGRAEASPLPLPIGVIAPELLEAATRPSAPQRADVLVQILDKDMNEIIGAGQMNEGRRVTLTDPTGQTPVPVLIDATACQNLVQYLESSDQFYVVVAGLSSGVEYSVETRPPAGPQQSPITLVVPGATREMARFMVSAPEENAEDAAPATPKVRGRGVLYGQQLRGGQPSSSPVAIAEFRSASPPRGDRVGFELRVGIERNTDEGGESDANNLQLTFVDRWTGKVSPPEIVHPENRRTTYFDVPAEYIRSGMFDVHIRNLSGGHFVGIKDDSLSMVASQQSFGINLFKSLLILWLLAVLVVIIALFCSTFLSWPTAIVLTMVILLSHWGVIQLGDALAPGIGNRVATDLFGAARTSAGEVRVVSSTVEALSRMVSTFGAVLPDIEQFAAIEDIERGVTIGLDRLIAPLLVLAAFGLPLVTLAYVRLRNMEVAP